MNGVVRSAGEPTVYGDYAVIEGQRIYFKSRIVSWHGWPEDVQDTLRAWNQERRLSFGNESYWGRLATGFAAFTLKCARCARLFNSSGSTAARFDGEWHCDDCMIAIARSASATTDSLRRPSPDSPSGPAVRPPGNPE